MYVWKEKMEGLCIYAHGRYQAHFTLQYISSEAIHSINLKKKKIWYPSQGG